MSWYEEFGKYTLHRELAEVHRENVEFMAVKIAMAATRAECSILELDIDECLRLLALAEISKNHFIKHANIANAAAKLCGRAPIRLEAEAKHGKEGS